ncbi:tyrosine-type recombinase/integrase [Crossiella sp. CA198]|uniref:tyrosine-type recombinase/integrase n=1 Tax=Crossiella sp. CA198 TaxID=3455607 RepID=UPI003F8D03FF
MNGTYKVNIWAIKEIKAQPGQKRRPKPYGVRWITAGEEHSEWYKTKKLADNRRSKLLAAAERGEAFDTVTGLPQSEHQQRTARSLLQLTQEFVDSEWDNIAPNTRKRNVDALAIPVANFVRSAKNAPEPRLLRRTLTTLLLPKNQRERLRSPEEDVIANWLEKNSRPVRELAEKVEVSKLLLTLGRNLNGNPATAGTKATRRAILYQLLNYGVDAKELTVNPVKGNKTTLEQGSREVDPRVVVNPRQAAQLLSAVTYVGQAGKNDYLYAFFAAMYYGAFRPCEVNRIRDDDLTLPSLVWDEARAEWVEPGLWGKVTLEKSASRAVGRYTDSGELWEERNLKRRAEGEVRVVPIPPQLVRVLRAHLARFGTTPDGRLFRGKKSSGPVNASVYTKIWKRARSIALPPAQYKSMLAKDPYDLRHAAVSTQLAAGVPVADVANRAGHSIEVLMQVYWKMLDGQQSSSNDKISDFYGDSM